MSEFSIFDSSNLKIIIPKIFKKPFHPLIFSTYPIINLYIRNYFLITINELIIVLIINFAVTFMFWQGIDKIIEDRKKSAVIISIFIILFFSFGHFLPAVTNILQSYLGLHIKPMFSAHVTLWSWILLGIWLMLFGSLVLFTFKSKSELQLITSLMNVISVTLAFLVIVQSTQITLNYLQLVSDENEKNKSLTICTAPQKLDTKMMFLS